MEHGFSTQEWIKESMACKKQAQNLPDQKEAHQRVPNQSQL